MTSPKLSGIQRCHCRRELPGEASEWKRVMGIEPIKVPREISDLGYDEEPSAMEVRIFAVRGASYGNVRQLPFSAERN
jgi:hypothetical protein